MLNVLKKQEVELIDQNNQLVVLQPLASWQAKAKDDLGVMLLEMWAYLCDAVSFYDEVLANEAYLRTSKLRPNLRRLIALLGYQPRPAVGSLVDLAALADGRLPVKLPAGTAFRSGAFDGNPPQVFELDDPATIHPLTNRWPVIPPHIGSVTANNPSSLLVSVRGEIREGDLLLLTNSNNQNQNSGLTVKKISKYTGTDQQQYTRVEFLVATPLAEGTPLENLRLWKPSLSSVLYTANTDSGTPASVDGNTLVLNSLVQQLKAGDLILVTYSTEVRWFKITQVAEVNRQATASSTMTINGNSFNLPGITVSVTQITLDADLNDSTRKLASPLAWNNSLRYGITVYYGMQNIGGVIDEPKTFLSSADPLYLSGVVEAPVDGFSPGRFLFQDKNTTGAGAGGSIDYNEKKITLDGGESWGPLLSPVDAYGNVIRASRGESVKKEKLGSGDASVPNQTFKLKKKPLTYLLAPTADNSNGIKSTLAVYVNNIKWKEVSSFFGMKENDQVYIVRQNDEGESMVIFGDGIRGERVPTGTDNILADYRFGAEAAVPPTGAVNQIAKPAKGLQSVRNLLPAFGGADAEPASDIKQYAPKSALLLGRVVSLQDMAALAGGFPGVRAVKTEWRWNRDRQCAAAHIFFIGAAGIEASLSQRLRNVSDPSTIIVVERAQAVPLTVTLSVQIDSKYLETDVLKQLRQALMDKQTGLLSPERIGIGLPLFRSRIFKAVLSIEGTVSVDSISLNGVGFTGYAVTPGAGRYYDVETGNLIINGTAN
jgi:hypothetical protein